MFVEVKKADYSLYAHFIIGLPLTYKRAANGDPFVFCIMPLTLSLSP